MIKIREIDNGFIITKPHPNTGGNLELAFTFNDDVPDFEKEECEAVKDLLWEVLEDIRIYSKHRKYNVVVNIEKDGEIME